MNTATCNFLAALMPNRNEKPAVKVCPPKGASVTPFNKPFVYTDIAQAEFGQNGLATQSLRRANEEKNVLVSVEGKAVFVMISDLEAVRRFTCQPSALIRVGCRHFVVWLFENDADLTSWHDLQRRIADFFGVRAFDDGFLPLVGFDLVESDGGKTPIELVELDAGRSYNVSELRKAAETSSELENAPKSAETVTAKSAEVENVEKVRKAKSAEVVRKSAETKGERTYRQFVRLIRSQMKSAEILKSAESALGLKSRRSEALIKSAVSRNDLIAVRRGVYEPQKSAETGEGLAIAE